MTRRKRTFLIAFIIFLCAMALIVGLNAANGGNSFAEGQRRTLILAIVCGLYVAFRGGILLERFFYRRASGAEKTKPGLPNRMFWKGNHAIQHRLAERRRRYEAAKAREADKDAD
ncbi:MAG: hypothetical protein AAGH90_07305 [Pseudomonadota bacterium]